MKKLFKYVASSVVAVAAFAVAPQVWAQANYPSQPLNFTIAFGPGGGNDLMSRVVVDILNKHKLYGDQNIIVTNRAGGSGAVGYSYVKQKAGSAYDITSTSGNFISTPLVSNTDWKYSDFTPVGLLASDAMFLVVRTDSGIKSVAEFVARAKQKKPLIGGTGAAGPSRVVAGLFAEKAGIDFTYMPAQTGGQMVTSLTSGSVDAIVANPSEVAGQITAGNFRALGYSSRQRSSVYTDVPTFVEQGVDVAFALPRGIVLAPGVSVATQNWWIDTMKKVIETPEWKEYLKTNSLSGTYLWGNDFALQLKGTNDAFERILKQIGAVK